jgi:hypothetical protein
MRPKGFTTARAQLDNLHGARLASQGGPLLNYTLGTSRRDLVIAFDESDRQSARTVHEPHSDVEPIKRRGFAAHEE